MKKENIDKSTEVNDFASIIVDTMRMMPTPVSVNFHPADIPRIVKSLWTSLETKSNMENILESLFIMPSDKLGENLAAAVVQEYHDLEEDYSALEKMNAQYIEALTIIAKSKGRKARKLAKKTLNL